LTLESKQAFNSPFRMIVIVYAVSRNLEEGAMSSRQSVSRALAAACMFATLLTIPAVEAAVMPTPGLDHATSAVQPAYGSCGPGRQPGQNGVCHPDGWFAFRRACPPGTHLGPYGRRCILN
jgi:hypothetical protein